MNILNFSFDHSVLTFPTHQNSKLPCMTLRLRVNERINIKL